MLGAYKASVAFLQEHKTALGGDHRTVIATMNSEMLHLTKLFRNEPLAPDDPASRSAITALIQHMRSDTSGTFAEDHRQKLIEIAATRLSAQSEEISSSAHGSQKSQIMMYSHRYMTSAQWDTICDDATTFKAKQTFFGQGLVGMGTSLS